MAKARGVGGGGKALMARPLREVLFLRLPECMIGLSDTSKEAN